MCEPIAYPDQLALSMNLMNNDVYRFLPKIVHLLIPSLTLRYLYSREMHTH